MASRIISPGHAAWEYYGYTRREYASVRELEPVMTRALWRMTSIGLDWDFDCATCPVE